MVSFMTQINGLGTMRLTYWPQIYEHIGMHFFLRVHILNSLKFKIANLHNASHAGI
jgi:hypothetical protein